jgi:multiple sugar transport system substrate-binding protein
LGIRPSNRVESTIDRRRLLASAAAAAGALGSIARAREASAGAYLSVLTPMPPDPAPPGVASYSLEALATWQTGFQSRVYYESAAWPQLHPKLVNSFAKDRYTHDVIYTSGWIPEFSEHLLPIGGLIPEAIRVDVPDSAFRAVEWQGETYGLVFTLSLLTLYFNAEHFAEAGISAAPANWAELKETAAELTRDGRFGWSSNYATPDGIGGTASYFMVFLQQAGGRMWNDDGLPAFHDETGVDALQFMVDLMPSTDPAALTSTSVIEPTNAFRAGRVSMMMNWPFMWSSVQDIKLSSVIGQVGTAILPAGPAGSASIDGADAWSVLTKSPAPEIALNLIKFYLDPGVQKQQALETGWLPIRKSVYADPDVQEALPHAATVLAQAAHPYNSFLTPDYAEVTLALGLEVQAALQGQKSPADALADAAETVTEIVKRRA